MTPRNLTELRKANDNHTQTDRNTTGGISADVLPRGSVLSGTLEIRVLEQMPRRGNPAHSHFLPLLPSPSVRPRNLHQLPHTMKTGRRKMSDMERMQLKEARKAVAAEHRELKKLARAREREEIKELKKLDRARQREQARAWGSKNQPAGKR